MSRYRLIKSYTSSTSCSEHVTKGLKVIMTLEELQLLRPEFELVQVPSPSDFRVASVQIEATHVKCGSRFIYQVQFEKTLL
jgi:hypothetical protein